MTKEHFELMTALDQAASELRCLDQPEFGWWLAYFLEAIDFATDDFSTLEEAQRILTDRLARGSW